jgi:hypothetical protein
MISKGHQAVALGAFFHVRWMSEKRLSANTGFGRIAVIFGSG